ncbi:MAG: XdhC/CoxI family protein [Spirochaetaceae bacterium]|jgi:xanthine dehydrogenase accessory factor|nr:XdhC/CoxI family protein [Spirochaetaceae bacterium]
MKDLLVRIKKSAATGEDLILAVIVDSSGSTPRGPGAMMLIGKEGRLWGTIGGAVPEHLAIEEGKKLIHEKRSVLRTYILHPNDIADIGAQCGGEISVFLFFLNSAESATAALMDAGIAGFSAPDPCWLAFSLDGEALGILDKQGIIAWLGEKPAELSSLTAPRPGRQVQGGKQWFSQPLVPDGFVYIFGGGHVAQELAPLLCHLDFRCAIFDDREEFTRSELFPDECQVIRGDFENIGASLRLTTKDYAVVVTRGHVFDFHAEAFALRSPASYIGVIGSMTKQRFVRQRLEKAGFSAEELDAPRIHAPIGVNIQSKTPAEVAVSIAGELILTRAKLAAAQAAELRKRDGAGTGV